MRSMFMRGLFIIIAWLGAVSAAGAGAWIEKISGDPAAVTLSRQGKAVKPAELVRLQPGDVLRVADAATSVRVLLASGALKVVDRQTSPYNLPGDTGNSSFLANLMSEAKLLLTSSGEKTETVAMMTRGRSDQVEIKAAPADENFVYTDGGPLAVAWQGGEGPFDLTLSAIDSDEVVRRADNLSAHAADLSLKNLAPGEYRVVVTAKGGRASSSEAEMTLVGREDLPEEAQKLLDMKLDPRVEARLLISLLHDHAEWRFYSRDLAARYGLDKEQKLIEAMQ